MPLSDPLLDPRYGPLAASDEVVEFCAAHIGDVEVVADLSWPHGGSRVLELRDHRGTGWIAKAMRRNNYRTEREAYQRWVPALGDRASQVVYSDDTLQVLVFRTIPGVIADGTAYALDPRIHHQAGALLRCLHDCAPPSEAADLATVLRTTVERAIDNARTLGLLEPADAMAISFVGQIIDDLVKVPIMMVPTHGDNQPRNWLVDDDGVVHLIDFGLTNLGWWGRDLNRLRQQQWRDRPDLQEAFFAGYGRNATPAEEVMLRARDAQSALTTMFWARERNDPSFEEHWHSVLIRMGL
jgi:aminoglycoside phosphotransferase